MSKPKMEVLDVKLKVPAKYMREFRKLLGLYESDPNWFLSYLVQDIGERHGRLSKQTFPGLDDDEPVYQLYCTTAVTTSTTI